MFFPSILAVALSAVAFVYADDISRDVVVCILLSISCTIPMFFCLLSY